MHLKSLLQLGRIHVALEGMLLFREHRLVNDQVEGHTPFVEDVGTRGVEMDVVGHQIALPEGDGKKEILGGTPLMGGDDIPEAEDGADGLLKVVIVFAAGVGFVAHHHPRPLIVAHGRSAAVGEQIDINARGGQGKNVISRFTDEAVALLAGGPAYGFDDLDPEGFSRKFHIDPDSFPLPGRAGVQADGWEGQVQPLRGSKFIKSA
ncbi:MAG: hypothetical protein BWY77_00870 [bacterium ADurb.Bin431]|nr:MAG: hypothetical protein BWY77_00870 [bacterium ADurb.Bin431]